MSRQIVTVPRALMRRSSVFDWDLDFRSQSAGPGTDGGEQVVLSRAPRFTGACELTLTRDTIAQWRAVRAAARGRVNALRIPMVDRRGWRQAGDAVTFSEGETFSAGEGFAYEPACRALTSAAAGDAHLDVDWLDNAVPPLQGMFLSYRDWPMIVTSVIPLSAFAATYRLTVERLAVAVPADALVNLRATGLFLFTEDTAAALSHGPTGAATPRVSVIEWVTR